MLTKVLVTSSLFACLIACSSTGQQAGSLSSKEIARSLQLIDDDLFAGDQNEQSESLRQFLTLPEEIRRQIDQEILPLESEEQRFRALRRWAFREFQDDYVYDPSFTSALIDLPRSKRVNCFSFSNMFVAAARYAGISAHFQLVDSPPQWDFNNETLIVIRHINVTGNVSRTLNDDERRYLRDQQRRTGSRIQRYPPAKLKSAYVVDLNPEIAVDAYRSEIVSDQEVLSLFYSNRAIEALLTGDNDAANRFSRLAILEDENSHAAWHNIGVLFSRADKLPQAVQAYLTALALDPGSESSANNLERVYRRMGELQKANTMQQRISANRKKNPYYQYFLGKSMLQQGELEEAVNLFRGAINRKEDERLFYFALAEAQIGLGEYRQAEENLKTAREYSDIRDSARYTQLSAQLALEASED